MSKKIEYVDLGLPSGRLWASDNAEGYYTYDEAKKEFGEMLPKPEAFKELWEECQWLWDIKNKGMIVVGPNKNTIFLPASGCRYYNSGELCLIGSCGYYWSCASFSQSHAHLLSFDSFSVYPLDKYNRAVCFSVRLCKEQL